jgi:hypothetical protein
LADEAPHLTTLRIDNPDYDTLAAQDSDFAFRVLYRLPRLRRLALPYAIVRHRDLFVAADRLESLEIRLITAARWPRHTSEYDRAAATIRMTRLTRLVADVWLNDEATHIFRRMPAVRSGRIAFRLPTYREGARESRLVAHLFERRADSVSDRDRAYRGSDSGDDDDDDDDAESSVTDTVVGSAERGLHVFWHAECIRRLDREMAARAGASLSKLHVRWISNDFSAQISAEARELLDEQLARARLTIESPASLAPKLAS